LDDIKTFWTKGIRESIEDIDEKIELLNPTITIQKWVYYRRVIQIILSELFFDCLFIELCLLTFKNNFVNVNKVVQKCQ
jgi:hypothetical protein